MTFCSRRIFLGVTPPAPGLHNTPRAWHSRPIHAKTAQKAGFSLRISYKTRNLRPGCLAQTTDARMRVRIYFKSLMFCGHVGACMSYRLSFKNNSLTLSNLSPLEPLTGCRRRSAEGETVGRSRTGSDAAQDAAEGAQRVGAGCGWAVPYL